MGKCESWVKALCKTKKLKYAAMVKKYPQAWEKGRVYINSDETSDKEHCTHCARAEAILKREK